MRKIYLVISDMSDDPHALYLDLDPAIEFAQKLFEDKAKTYHRSFEGGVFSCENGTFDLKPAWTWSMPEKKVILVF